jgi:hypothetical protein
MSWAPPETLASPLKAQAGGFEQEGARLTTAQDEDWGAREARAACASVQECLWWIRDSDLRCGCG